MTYRTCRTILLAGILAIASLAYGQASGITQSLESVFAPLLASANSGQPLQLGQVEVCFTPRLAGTCDPDATVIDEINRARQSIRVQMYSLTDEQIV